MKDRGISFRLAYFKPAHTIAEDALVSYDQNILSVVRQLRYSLKTDDELDLTLFVNGIPVATAKLKNQTTGTTVDNAKEQYRKDRDPKELLFAKRTLVHFAVDQDLVFVTTRLSGAAGETLALRQEICRLLAVTNQTRLARSLTGSRLVDTRNAYGDDHPETQSVQELLNRLEQVM